MYMASIGEPVLFVQTALTADELLPIARQPVLADRYQKILYHRRGYAGSSSSGAPGALHDQTRRGSRYPALL
jgi:hypothetical protein